MQQNPDPMIYLIPVTMVVALGAFFSVVGFARERRREREALYRHETARALVEKGAMDAAQFLAMEREEALRPWRARLETIKLLGLVCALAGVGLLIGMRAADEAPARGIGWMPLGIGAGALLYAWVLARREP
jgi:hypothetical protein